MTLRETLAEGLRLLKLPGENSSVDTPALDAALLLAETFKIRREELLFRDTETVGETEREEFFSLVERRRSGECVAYILGRKEFRGLDFIVNPHVLVPRPDTETLVEAALEYIDTFSVNNDLSLLDLCTGSGAVGISLKKERPFLSVTVSDISRDALDVAAENANVHVGVGAVEIIQSDLFENITGRFNIILSNPPYIPVGDLSALSPEVQREPRLALDGGEDGLELIRKIISQAPDRLLPGGGLFLEAAPEQMPEIRTILEEQGFSSIKTWKDLAGRERVISGCKR